MGLALKAKTVAELSHAPDRVGYGRTITRVWSPRPGMELFLGGDDIADALSVLRRTNIQAKCHLSDKFVPP